MATIATRIPSLSRALSTLPNNTHIKVFKPSPSSPHYLTLLDTEPPTPHLALGSSPTLPPTPASFSENHTFTTILHDVLREFGHQDTDLKAQARALASPGGARLGDAPTGRITPAGAGGASAQGGPGGARRGGFVHLADRRNPPDFGRTAWPEDILGSVEVDGKGEVVGRLQLSGTYRLITNQGILGLSPFMREKLLSRLRREEAKERHS